MMRSNGTRTGVAALVVIVGLTGCQAVREHPRTSAGAGVGAAGGAVVGGLISRNTTGVVVGGLLGALAGGAIGHYLDRQDRSRAEAVSASGYVPTEGTVIRVDSVHVSPAEARPGQAYEELASLVADLAAYACGEMPKDALTGRRATAERQALLLRSALDADRPIVFGSDG